jgi:hypothetical protein
VAGGGGEVGAQLQQGLQGVAGFFGAAELADGGGLHRRHVEGVL